MVMVPPAFAILTIPDATGYCVRVRSLEQREVRLRPLKPPAMSLASHSKVRSSKNRDGWGQAVMPEAKSAIKQAS